MQSENQKPDDSSSGTSTDFEDTDDIGETNVPSSEMEFRLKDETEYIQLRLSVTSSDGKKQETEDYLTERLGAETSEDQLGNSYIASPRETYDRALNAIIDCPYTENVVYKNEDYYPVACEIFTTSVSDGKVPIEAIEHIESIEKMCRDIIIVVN